MSRYQLKHVMSYCQDMDVSGRLNSLRCADKIDLCDM